MKPLTWWELVFLMASSIVNGHVLPDTGEQTILRLNLNLGLDEAEKEGHQVITHIDCMNRLCPVSDSPETLGLGWMDLGGEEVIDAKAQPAVVSWAENRVDVFIRGKDNAVWHLSAEDESWASWESLGGSINGNVEAVSWEPGCLAIYARGLNNDVLYKLFWEGRWGDWRTLGGSITGDISATFWRDHYTIVLVARGTDNTVVACATSTGSWITLSGDFWGSPKVLSSSDHRIDIFMRGLDNAVYQKANVGLWLPPGELEWTRLGGNATSDIAVVSKRQDTLSLFFQGKDNALWHKDWNGTSWQPSADKWNRLGGILVSRPSVNTFSDEGINVFVQGTDNALWRKTWNGTSWMSSKSYGGKIVSPPVTTQGRNAVYAMGPNGTLLQYRYSNPVVKAAERIVDGTDL